MSSVLLSALLWPFSKHYLYWRDKFLEHSLWVLSCIWTLILSQKYCDLHGYYLNRVIVNLCIASLVWVCEWVCIPVKTGDLWQKRTIGSTVQERSTVGKRVQNQWELLQRVLNKRGTIGVPRLQAYTHFRYTHSNREPITKKNNRV